MTPLQQAHAAGFSQVGTFAGKINFNQWHIEAGRLAGFDLETGRIYGPWRPLTSLEQMFADEKIFREFTKARDSWELFA